MVPHLLHVHGEDGHLVGGPLYPAGPSPAGSRRHVDDRLEGQHGRPGGVGSARMERKGDRFLPAPRRPTHGRMDPVSLDLASAVTAARSVRVLWSRLVQMSFLGLSVLPELRLTDKGLVDVEAFELVPVAVD